MRKEKTQGSTERGGEGRGEREVDPSRAREPGAVWSRCGGRCRQQEAQPRDRPTKGKKEAGEREMMNGRDSDGRARGRVRNTDRILIQKTQVQKDQDLRESGIEKRLRARTQRDRRGKKGDKSTDGREPLARPWHHAVPSSGTEDSSRYPLPGRVLFCPSKQTSILAQPVLPPKCWQQILCSPTRLLLSSPSLTSPLPPGS